MKMTKKQKKKHEEIWQGLCDWKRNPGERKVLTIDELFENAPDGDFVWEGEAGDWNVYHRGENDCPVGWHLVAYYIDMGRRDGKRFVEYRSVDSDGDHDFVCGYNEAHADDFPDDWNYLAGLLSNESNNFFMGWCEYWLDAAETGKDPCEQAMRVPDNWVDFCLDAAADNLKYLRM